MFKNLKQQVELETAPAEPARPASASPQPRRLVDSGAADDAAPHDDYRERMKALLTKKDAYAARLEQRAVDLEQRLADANQALDAAQLRCDGLQAQVDRLVASPALNARVRPESRDAEMQTDHFSSSDFCDSQVIDETQAASTENSCRRAEAATDGASQSHSFVNISAAVCSGNGCADGKHAESQSEVQERAVAAEGEFDELLLRNASLSHELEVLRRQRATELDDVDSRMNQLRQQVVTQQTRLGELEPRDTAEDESSCRSSEQLRQALRERDTTIRLQQQRLADLKKTLQKELKRTPTPTDAAASTETAARGDEADGGGGGGGDDLPLAYLRHVVLRFVTAEEGEARQLVRALTALLRLSVDEQRLLRDTVHWRQSWLPVHRPRLPASISNA